MERLFYVYILASEKRGTLYIGVTHDLSSRVQQHKDGAIDGFTKKYHVHQLVYAEPTTYFMAAVEREKQLKKWKRQWKIDLIETLNPEWKDLSDTL